MYKNQFNNGMSFHDLISVKMSIILQHLRNLFKQLVGPV